VQDRFFEAMFVDARQLTLCIFGEQQELLGRFCRSLANFAFTEIHQERR